MRYSILIDGHEFTAFVRRLGAGFQVEVNGTEVEVVLKDGVWHVDGVATPLTVIGDRLESDGSAVDVRLLAVGRGEGRHVHGSGEVRPPLPGKVVALRVAEGDEVKVGETLVVLEAMKMQNEITSPRAGRVVSVGAKVGDTVDPTTVLVTIA
ncbi:MAG: biotin/lipoyl-binding protein [Euryarchaeota archaeon]|nr:biotin/lipoyl-binding protein [Euryarchaeota archaeon]